MELRTLLAGVACATLATTGFAQTLVGQYDASKGTLPTSQGFEAVVSGPMPPAAVVGGVLKQGLTTDDGWQCWQLNAPLSTAKRIQVETRIMIESSTYRNGVCGAGQRTGYYIGVADGDGRMAYIGLAGDRVCIFNNIAAQIGINAPVVMDKIAGRWITLRFEMTSTETTLDIDGVRMLSMPEGAAGASPTLNRVFFGDGTACGMSKSQLAWLKVTTGTACPVDFNDDGAVDFLDYDAFVTCFEGGGCPAGKTADFNDDGAIDFFDFDDFVVAFEKGCGNTTSTSP